MDKLNKLSLAELTEKLAKVGKDIESEKELLGEAKNAHFQDGEVWLTYKLQIRPIEKIEDNKTKKPLFNKKQISEVRKGLEKISELRKERNELLLEKVKRELNNELYKGIIDYGDNTKSYLSLNFRIEDIKEYGNRLSDQHKYKYYTRLDIELARIINAFHFSEFKRFDGNMYFGLIEFFDSVEYIIEKEKCPELERITREKIKHLDIYAGIKEFERAISMIEAELLLLPEQLVKTRELLGYELDYLSKILTIDDRNKTESNVTKEGNPKLIEEKLKTFDSARKKLNYLYELKKELSNIIYAFNNTILKIYTKENDNIEFYKASELGGFVEDLRKVREIECCEELNDLINGLYEDVVKKFESTDYYKKYYSKEDPLEYDGKLEDIDDDLFFGVYCVGEKIKDEINKYNFCENFVLNEIEYWEKQLNIKRNEEDENRIANDLQEDERQRAKIKEYLLENYKDFQSNFDLNINQISYEITDHYYPSLSKTKRKKKKESIRQELMLFKNGKIPLQ